jgi:hypothetical protein
MKTEPTRQQQAKKEMREEVRSMRDSLLPGLALMRRLYTAKWVLSRLVGTGSAEDA